MNGKREKYIVVSGEGDGNGTIEAAMLTEIGAKRRLTRERAGGDRWARAYYRCRSDASSTWIDCETGEARHFHGYA